MKKNKKKKHIEVPKPLEVRPYQDYGNYNEKQKPLEVRSNQDYDNYKKNKKPKPLEVLPYQNYGNYIVRFVLFIVISLLAAIPFAIMLIRVNSK